MTGGKTSYENMHKYKHMEELYCEKYKILFFYPSRTYEEVLHDPPTLSHIFTDSNFLQFTPTLQTFIDSVHF